MELRHLRYFIAVAEEGSLTLAAEKRLHTAQPSLSRQIRDLEHEVGVQLITRSVHGVELTAAGRAFLDHARLAVTQAEAAKGAARRAAQPTKATLALGFLSGTEMDLLPKAMRVLQDKLPNIEVKLSSDYSPRLADALLKGRLDAAFMRPDRKREISLTSSCAEKHSSWSSRVTPALPRTKPSGCGRSKVSHSSNRRRPRQPSGR